MKQSTRVIQALECAGFTRAEPSRRQAGFLLALQPSGAYRISFYIGSGTQYGGAYAREIVASYSAALERKGFYVRALPDECALVARPSDAGR